MQATVTTIQRFPVKGLSPEALPQVTLTAGEGVPGDRLYGFARSDSGFDPEDPKPMAKQNFVVLVNEAALAGLRTHFDAKTEALSVEDGATTHAFHMDQPEERARAERFLFERLALRDSGPPRFVSSAPHRFTDVSVVSPQMMNAVSLLNLNSVRDLEQRLGAAIDPGRFRMNIVTDGLPAWCELDAVGATLSHGDLRLRVLKRTQRCAATEVNPETAERDLRLPYLLRKEMGHMDMGIYAEVESGGQLAPGDNLQLEA